MIMIIICVFLLGLMILGAVKDNEVIASGFGTIFVIFLVISLCILPIGYMNNISNFEAINMLNKNKLIYEKQANEILPQFKEILEEKYGSYEKGIYNKITTNNYNMYLVKYPELKNIEAVKLLVEKMQTYMNKTYEMDILIEEKKASIRTRQQNPFLLVKKYNVD